MSEDVDAAYEDVTDDPELLDALADVSGGLRPTVVPPPVSIAPLDPFEGD